jgi:alpha-tubulin suppressor-like RCC1 family protein
LWVLVLSLVAVPAMAAQTCNVNAKVMAPNSRYVDPGAGKAQCWGLNTYGQLGNGTATDSATPVTVSGIRSAMAMGAGNSHSCTLLFDGTVQCWGWNGNGQLGNGSTTDSYVPVSVSGITDAAALAVGSEHSCVRLANGTVQCWGLNTHGQLGNATMTDSSIPVTVSGIVTATAIAAGDAHSCALLADGTVQCWGLNDYGQLGNGNITPALAPVQVCGIGPIPNPTTGCPTGTTATAIAAGGSHSCARLSDGTVKCWGSNADGQVGNNTTTPRFLTPVAVTGIGTATTVAAGTGHSCARLADGTVKCWGLNADGQLGDSSTTDAPAPVTVSGINTAMEIAAGGNHSCARLSSGAVQCWGQNADGQLGNGNTTNTPAPVTVSGVSNAAAIATGSHHSCARLSIGTGTVVDTSTSLMWKRCSEGQTWDAINEVCAGNAQTYTWQGALQRVTSVNQGSTGQNIGHNDWRLPNRNELASLVEYQCKTPAINATVFPSTAAAPYWSSSPSAGHADRAWQVNMLDGGASDAFKTGGAYIRFVRGGN